MIDGEKVAQTQKRKIDWPSFEIDILDHFQLHMFTLPSKIELELVINGEEIDRINLIIPGGNVKTLTSASRIINEYEFSKRRNYFENYARSYDIEQEIEHNELTEDQKTKL